MLHLGWKHTTMTCTMRYFKFCHLPVSPDKSQVITTYPSLLWLMPTSFLSFPLCLLSFYRWLALGVWFCILCSMFLELALSTVFPGARVTLLPFREFQEEIPNSFSIRYPWGSVHRLVLPSNIWYMHFLWSLSSFIQKIIYIRKEMKFEGW